MCNMHRSKRNCFDMQICIFRLQLQWRVGSCTLICISNGNQQSIGTTTYKTYWHNYLLTGISFELWRWIKWNWELYSCYNKTVITNINWLDSAVNHEIQLFEQAKDIDNRAVGPHQYHRVITWYSGTKFLGGNWWNWLPSKLKDTFITCTRLADSSFIVYRISG